MVTIEINLIVYVVTCITLVSAIRNLKTKDILDNLDVTQYISYYYEFIID